MPHVLPPAQGAPEHVRHKKHVSAWARGFCNRFIATPSRPVRVLEAHGGLNPGAPLALRLRPPGDVEHVLLTTFLLLSAHLLGMPLTCLQPAHGMACRDGADDMLSVSISSG